MTDSKMKLEILVGYKRTRFAQALYTQRRDLQAGNINLRPGGLLSLREHGASGYHNFLFLHTDSGKSAKDYNNRQAMFRKIWQLKAALEGLPIQNGNARLVALGDLNTMGRSRTATLPTVRARDEIANLKQDASTNGMRVLTKSEIKTWSNPSGSVRSELDHVVASNDIQLQMWTDPSREVDPYEVEVNGWNGLTGNARRFFIENVSDHNSLFGEIV